MIKQKKTFLFSIFEILVVDSKADVLRKRQPVALATLGDRSRVYSCRLDDVIE
jgi:hypothetical protein